MSVQPLQCQVEASRFATRRPDAERIAANIRANTLPEVTALLLEGRPGRAHAALMRSFTAQAHALGLRYAGIVGGEWLEER